MISPIGSMLVRFDGGLTGAIDGLAAAMANNVAAPLVLTATAFYTLQGIKLANGDGAPLVDFVPTLLRIGFVLYFATNVDVFNYYVRGLLMEGLPAALAGTNGNTISASGALLDSLYAQTWVAISSCWQLAGFSLTGLVSGISGILVALFGGLGLAIIGLIIVGARFTLGVMTILGPALIGCAIFDYTRPFFDRAVGYVVSTVIVIAAAAITVNVMVLGTQWFLARATEGIITASTNAGAGYETVQVLLTLCVWFLAAGWMMLQVKSLAFSIGGGIAGSGPSMLDFFLLTRGGAGGRAAGGAGTAAAPAPSLGLDVARQELAGARQASLPPPPPPSLSYSTRR